jgi:ERF superfamily protein
MIYEKLLKFQKLGITVEKDADNPFFKSKYTSLNQVLEKVKKPLNDTGVLIVQQPTVIDGTSGLHTVLTDTEDSSNVESFIPFVGATDMQKLGGAISYARRYALISMLGLEDEDKDGEDTVSHAKDNKKATSPVDLNTEPDFTI